MTPSPARNITFNGYSLSAQHQAQLEMVENYYGVRIQDNHYWYDPATGAVGIWGGPAVAALPAGMELGGPMPPHCSGGGTGVFVNGRELHPYDVMALSRLGPVMPGRYWVDAYGNFGYEYGPMLGNLSALMNQSAGSQGQHRVYAPGELSGITMNEAGAFTDQGNSFYPG